MIKTKLIGVSGCTNGGKTTLCKRLMSELANAYHLSQDDFYHERGSSHYTYMPELSSFNYDVISAIDMKRFHAELARLFRSPQRYSYILCDGILLYEDEKLFKMFDKRYFLELPKEECERRRKQRHYAVEDTSDYFDKCAWREYLKYRQKCGVENGHRKNIIFLNGTQKPGALVDYVINDLNNNTNNNINNNNNNIILELQS